MMPKLNILLLFLLCCGQGWIYGQSVAFQITGDEQIYIDEAAYGIHEVAPDTFLLVGRYNGPSLGSTDTEVYRFTPNGDPERLFYFHLPEFDHIISSALSPGSKYLYLVHVTSHNSPTGGERMVLTKVDLEGNQIWQQILDRGFTAYGETIYVLPNGKIIVGGYMGEVGWSANWWITCFDPEGNLLWERTWLRYDLELIESISLGINGDILIGGRASDSTNANVLGTYIMAIDEYGNERWSFHHPDDGEWHSGYIGSMKVDQEGNIYAVEQDGFDKFFKFSPNGEIIWEKEGANVSFVEFDQDGNVIFGGQYDDVSPAGIMVRKYTPDGELLFENTLAMDFRLGITKMILCSDGGIAFCGGVPDTSTSALVGDVLFVKLNCEGQLVANANACNPEPGFEYPLVDNLLIQGDLLSAPLLSHPEGLSGVIELYDLMGRRVAVWGGASDRNSGIDLSGFSESVYLYRLRSEDALVRMGRIQLVR